MTMFSLELAKLSKKFFPIPASTTFFLIPRETHGGELGDLFLT